MYDTALKAGETEEQYLWRLGQAKDNGVAELNWTEIAYLMNSNFREEDEYYAESSYRKPYTQAKRFYEAGVFDAPPASTNTEKYEVQMERQLVVDERRELRQILRDQARANHNFDLLAKEIAKLGRDRYVLPSTIRATSSPRDMIVMLSDPHFGQFFDNWMGYYDLDTARERVHEYARQVVAVGKPKGVNTCYVVGLGDFISGNIHKNVAITNRENVIEQIMAACEIIADFVTDLASEFPKVEFHCVSGNHSRIERKEDALTDERLDALIPWYVKNVLSHIHNVTVVDEEMDGTICILRIKDKLYVGVHGDYDSMKPADISKLALWLGEIPYCVMMGHRHYNAITEVGGIKVVQGGSLSGTGDNHTRENRLTGYAQQMMMIINDGEIESYHPVTF